MYLDGSHRYQAFVVAERNGRWDKGIMAPGTRTLNKGGNAAVQSVSCARAGDCSVGGFYRDGANHNQALVLDSRNGTWRTVVSCGSAGSCAAGGLYHSGPTQVEAFIVTQPNSRWGTARQVPGTLALNAGQDAFITSLSCVSAGNCSAAGSYTDSTGHSWPFVVSDKNGKWGTAAPAPGVRKLSGLGGFGEINSLSSASAGNCAGVGQYNDSTSHSQAFVITQRGGTWSFAIKVPGLATLNRGDSASAAVVSCRAPAGCTAGGFYPRRVRPTGTFRPHPAVSVPDGGIRSSARLARRAGRSLPASWPPARNVAILKEITDRADGSTGTRPTPSLPQP